MNTKLCFCLYKITFYDIHSMSIFLDIFRTFVVLCASKFILRNVKYFPCIVAKAFMSFISAVISWKKCKIVGFNCLVIFMNILQSLITFCKKYFSMLCKK